VTLPPCESAAPIPGNLLVQGPGVGGYNQALGTTDADLEPLECSADGRGIRPTLFLGLGGTASLVLRKLRRRLCERFGSMPLVPCWRMLLLDTDASTFRAAGESIADESLSPDESLLLSLRRPAEYRARSHKLLGWLSRRWLYNIPRSLRTEGMRPLGRLAYVDHAERIADRIRRALIETTSDAAKLKSAETTGARLRGDAPRVFVISSICGGTGGGMLFDVAYVVQAILAELGFPADGACGVLTHGTLKKGAANDLRKANAYATLTEWNHFSADRPPFGDSYLIDLGDNLTEAEFGAAASMVARYLYLDAATPCGAALDHYRDLTRGRSREARGEAMLRTFGLHVMGCDKCAVADAQAELLCQRVVGRWHGDGRPVDPAGLHLDTSELGIDPLSKRLFAVADKTLGGKADVHFRGLLSQPPGVVSGVRDSLARIDAVLGAPQGPDRQSDTEPTRFATTLDEATNQLAAAVGESIVRAASGLVEDPRGRLPAALAAASQFQEHLRSLRQEAEERFRQAHAETAALRAKLVRGDGAGSARGHRWRNLWGGPSQLDAEARLLEYCERRLRTLVYQHLAALLQSTAGAVAALSERLVRLRSRFEQLGLGFAAPTAASAAGGAPAAVAHSKIVEAAAHAELTDPAFAIRLDERLQREWLEPNGGLMALGAADDEAWKSLRDQLQSQSRAAALAAMRGVDAARLLIEGNPDMGRQTRSLAAAIEKAVPRLSRFGGGVKRLLAVVPDSAYGNKLAETVLGDLSETVLNLFDADAELVLCQEAEGLSAARVAAALIDNRPDYAAAARRLLTRVDIRWTSLPLDRERHESKVDKRQGERGDPMNTTTTAASPKPSHAPDFKSVDWFGVSYSFTPPQAACVAVLWRAWLGGTPIVREEWVLEVARVPSRSLADLFRSGPGRYAWGTMIANGDKRGTVRLSEPEDLRQVDS